MTPFLCPKYNSTILAGPNIITGNGTLGFPWETLIKSRSAKKLRTQNKSNEIRLSSTNPLNLVEWI